MSQSLQQFLNNRGFHHFEGYSQQVPQQIDDLIRLTADKNIRRVMEIGFNAGHSAEVLLKNNPTIELTSFDLGTHNYVLAGKEYIDLNYPNRHTLILGDSRNTVPTFIQNNPNAKFDVIFIDGGHTYEIASADLENCMRLAHQDTIVMIDDTIYTSGWEMEYTIGPTRAWLEFKEAKKIVEIARIDYCPGRGMSWGKYVVN